MAVSMTALLDDLQAETDAVGALVARLDDDSISTPTPSLGWDIRDQLTHLAFFDELARQAAVDPTEFRRVAEAEAGTDHPDRVAAEHAHMGAAEVRSWFLQARQEFIDTFRTLDPSARLPWYGPDMSAATSVTARLLETWAHGQDIADALGVRREPTDRLRHVAHLGVRTAGFSFALHGRAAPSAPVRVELVGPSGDVWTWGDADAADRVSGDALDFCLVVTQRRNVADTDLEVVGPVATEWISIAQAFAGEPGPGRAPGAFPRSKR
ncbi:TIGR03084 family metal-binding protein [Pseudonocardia sp. CA-142604]|uniref:TIGR03084 family metal-binding protein n=1 Tax=Pseudonocardia sp. CA-142604 TaxID=3240024 RepID=UPI003D8D69F9